MVQMWFAHYYYQHQKRLQFFEADNSHISMKGAHMWLGYNHHNCRFHSRHLLRRNYLKEYLGSVG